MKCYVVGGAVRDALLGLPVVDRDHVVVGATPEQMAALGYRPVGVDFPVFLHPRTHEEYALARSERKTAPGYRGFVFHTGPEITLEDDLLRRDLTINAMARALRDDGGLDDTVIDPYGGQRDLQARVLRHVSPAFAEDPVRILRLARFAARFADFSVAPETQALMAQMVRDGEVDALVPERVWQELARGLMEDRPSRMLTVLRDCGALARLLPELDAMWDRPQDPAEHPEGTVGAHMLRVVDMAAQLGGSLEVRFAALAHDFGKGATADGDLLHRDHEILGLPLIERACARLKAPAACRDLALMTAREHGMVYEALHLDAEAIIAMLDRCDAWRKPARVGDMLLACEADLRGRAGFADVDYPQFARLTRAMAAARQVDAGAVARDVAQRGAQVDGQVGLQVGRQAGGQGAAIAAALRAHRVAAVRQALG